MERWEVIISIVNIGIVIWVMDRFIGQGSHRDKIGLEAFGYKIRLRVWNFSRVHWDILPTLFHDWVICLNELLVEECYL